MNLCLILLLTILLLFCGTHSAQAWPLDSQWVPVPKGGQPIQDPQNDAGGSRNIVPDNGTDSAAYTYNDGVSIFFRFRLDDDPSGTGGQGLLQSFGWGFEIDTDQNADDYEWLMMCDGISSPEIIALRENTEKSHLGDPSDTAEFIAAQYPLAGNYRITAADTCFDSKWNPTGVCNAQNDYQDYFLDYKIPYAVFKAATGITDSTLIRYFVGSSSAANNLTENGADLVAGSDLYQMASDYVTAFGYLPAEMTFYDGGVRFVDDLNGAYDRNVAAPGDTLYLRIDDLDLTAATTPAGTIVVTVTSPTGDSERVTLYATGVRGKYTGALPTATANSAGTLYILDGQTATVTYIDAVDAQRQQSQPRSDSIYFTAAGTDLALAKSVDTPAPVEGQTVTFTVTVTNNGPSAVAAATIGDTLPAGLTLTGAATGNGSYAGGIWTLGAPLAAGASASLTLTAAVDAGTNGQTLVNTATLNSSTPNDAYAANNSASATVRIGGTDLRVTKSVDEPLPLEDDTIQYTVRVLNLGPAATSGVLVTDLLPAGVTYVSHTVSQGSYAGGTGLWDVGTLAVGAGGLLRINATVDTGTTGQIITNTATLTGSSQPDTNPANDSASATIKVEYLDLTLTKEVRRYAPTTTSFGENVAANIGNTVEYRITVDNHGPHDASGIIVTDTLPAGLTYVAGSATVSHGSYDATSRTWTLGALADKEAATLTFRATVNTGTAGQSLVNSAEITAVDQPDSNPGDEFDTALVSVNGTDLRIIKSASNSTPNPGDSVTWIVTIHNDGPNIATGITASDILPPGITRTSHTTTQGTWSATGGNPSYIWTVGTIAVNASATLTIVTSVNAGTTGQTIVNNAFITGADQADPDDANNVASAAIYVAGTDLAMSKSVDDATPNVGQQIVYTLTVSNTGPATATNVTVTDLLPPEVAYVAHDPAAAGYDNLTGLWTIGTLANGASATLQITATVLNEDNNLVITNTASVDADQADPDPADNSASADITVNATDLVVSKTVDNATPPTGGVITYSVKVSNNGANPASGIEIDDILPAGVTLVSSTPESGSTYSAGVWLIGSLAGGAEATLTLSATVDAGTAGSTITNTATLTALDQIDIDPGNDSASVDIVPVAPPPLSIIKWSTAPSAKPGENFTYWIQVDNSGTTPASNVYVDDYLSPYLYLAVDTYSPGVHVNFIPGTSGLTADATLFSQTKDTTFGYTPASGNGGAPTGTDGLTTNWRQTFTGTMNPGGQFFLQFQVQVR